MTCFDWLAHPMFWERGCVKARRSHMKKHVRLPQKLSLSVGVVSQSLIIVPVWCMGVAWSDVPAVQNKQVYCISEAYLGRPGPRVVEGIEALHRCVQAYQKAHSG